MYQNFHIDVIKLIFIKYSISDLYRNDPGSGKSLQRASNLRQGKFESRFMQNYTEYNDILTNSEYK